MFNKLLLSAAVTTALATSSAFGQQQDQNPQTDPLGQSQQPQQGQQPDALILLITEWDTDQSGDISQEEWNRGMAQEGTFDDLDTNGDQMLSQEEFDAGFGDAGHDYDEWDSNQDRQLSLEETNEGLYGSYDENRDNTLDDQEFSRFEEDKGRMDIERLARTEPDRLGGESVYTGQDELLGVAEIQEIVASTDDGELYAVISSEEFFQIDELAAVPLSEFTWRDETVIYNGSEQEVEQLFEQMPYEEAMYQPVEETRSEQQVGAL